MNFASELTYSAQIQPDVLLGSDQYWSLLTGEIVRSEGGPAALNSRLWWILSGPAVAARGAGPASTLVTHTLRVDGINGIKVLERELHSFWSIESLGILETEEMVQSQFEDHVSFSNGRYTVSLPWKDPCLSLPTNYSLSFHRLNSLFKRLKETPELLQKYDDIIQEQLVMGIVTIVPANEDHAVIRKDKSTTKLRIVYDVSAKMDGPSLNECLYAGPSLHQKILDILVRFRLFPIALVADIEKAFLMIQVADSDQDSLRFLWFKDVHAEAPEVQVFKFTRVVFGVAPSPSLLNATIAQHLKQFQDTHNDLVQQRRDSIYVDDIVTGAYSIERAF